MAEPSSIPKDFWDSLGEDPAGLGAEKPAGAKKEVGPTIPQDFWDALGEDIDEPEPDVLPRAAPASAAAPLDAPERVRVEYPERIQPPPTELETSRRREGTEAFSYRSERALRSEIQRSIRHSHDLGSEEISEEIATVVASGLIDVDDLPEETEEEAQAKKNILRHVERKREERTNGGMFDAMARGVERLDEAFGGAVVDHLNELRTGRAMIPWQVRSLYGLAQEAGVVDSSIRGHQVLEKGRIVDPSGVPWVENMPMWAKMSYKFGRRMLGHDKIEADIALRSMGYHRQADWISKSDLALLLGESAGDILRDMERPERLASAVVASGVPLTAEERQAVRDHSMVESVYVPWESKRKVLANITGRGGAWNALLPVTAMYGIEGILQDFREEFSDPPAGSPGAAGHLFRDRSLRGGDPQYAAPGREWMGFIPLPPDMTGRNDLRDPQRVAEIAETMERVKEKVRKHLSTMGWDRRRNDAARTVLAIANPMSWVPFSGQTPAHRAAAKQTSKFFLKLSKEFKADPKVAKAAAESLEIDAERAVRELGPAEAYYEVRDNMKTVMANMTGQEQHGTILKREFDDQVGGTFGRVGPELVPGIDLLPPTVTRKVRPIKGLQKLLNKRGMKKSTELLVSVERMTRTREFLRKQGFEDLAEQLDPADFRAVREAERLALEMSGATDAKYKGKSVVLDRLNRWVQDELDFYQNSSEKIEHVYRQVAGMFMPVELLDGAPSSRLFKHYKDQWRGKLKGAGRSGRQRVQAFIRQLEEEHDIKVTPEFTRDALDFIEAPKRAGQNVAPKLREMILPKVWSEFLTPKEMASVDDWFAKRLSLMLTTEDQSQRASLAHSLFRDMKAEILLIQPQGADGRSLGLRMLRRAELYERQMKREAMAEARPAKRAVRGRRKLQEQIEKAERARLRFKKKADVVLAKSQDLDEVLDSAVRLREHMGLAALRNEPLDMGFFREDLASLKKAFKRVKIGKEYRKVLRRLAAKKTLKPDEVKNWIGLIGGVEDYARTMKRELGDFVPDRYVAPGEAGRPMGDTSALEDIAGVDLLKTLRSMKKRHDKMEIAISGVHTRAEEYRNALEALGTDPDEALEQAYARANREYAKEIHQAYDDISPDEMAQLALFMNDLLHRSPDPRIQALADLGMVPESSVMAGRGRVPEGAPPEHMAMGMPEGAPVGDVRASRATQQAIDPSMGPGRAAARESVEAAPIPPSPGEDIALPRGEIDFPVAEGPPGAPDIPVEPIGHRLPPGPDVDPPGSDLPHEYERLKRVDPVLSSDNVLRLVNEEFDPRVRSTNAAMNKMVKWLKEEFADGLRLLHDAGYTVAEISGWVPHIVGRHDLVMRMQPIGTSTLSTAPSPKKHRYYDFLDDLRNLGLQPVDDAKMAYAMWRGTVETMLAWADLESNIIRSFGRKVKGAKPGTGRVLLNRRMGQPGVGVIRGAERTYVSGGKVYAVPSEVAEHIDRLELGFKNGDKSLGQTNAVWKWFTQTWKGLATGVFPRFHERNVVSSMWNAWTYDVNDPRVYLESLKTLMVPGATTDIAGAAHPTPRTPTSMQKLGMQSDPAAWADEMVLGSDITHRQIREELNEFGVLQKDQNMVELSLDHEAEHLRAFGGRTKAERNMLKLQRMNPASRQFYAVKLGREVGHSIESWLRAAAYIDGRVNKGMGKVEAMARTIKIHFDYDDITPFLRFLRDNVTPFSTWKRKNLGLQMDALLHRPNKFYREQQLLSYVEALGGNDEVDQTWMPEFHEHRLGLSLARRVGAVPAGLVMHLGSPRDDLSSLSTFIPSWLGGDDRDAAISHELIGMLYPIFKAPFSNVLESEGKAFNWYTRNPDHDARVPVPRWVEFLMKTHLSWQDEGAEGNHGWNGMRSWLGVEESDWRVGDPADQRYEKVMTMPRSVLRKISWMAPPVYYLNQFPSGVDSVQFMSGEDLTPEQERQRSRIMGAVTPMRPWQYDPVKQKAYIMRDWTEKMRQMRTGRRNIATSFESE